MRNQTKIFQKKIKKCLTSTIKRATIALESKTSHKKKRRKFCKYTNATGYEYKKRALNSIIDDIIAYCQD